MDIHTISSLIQLNLDFYTTTAQAFDTTRNHNWPGWETLLTHLEGSKIKTVVDLGCGNGRFGTFAFENFKHLSHYTGVDANPSLLAVAAQTLATQKNKVTLTEENIIASFLHDKPLSFESKKFDLITIFGVMHHIPSAELRQKMLTRLAALLTPEGKLLFTTWNFLEFERFANRIVPASQLGFDTEKLEKNDYFLDWRRGERAIRYCHAYTTEEVEKLLDTTPLQLQATYRADGRENGVNSYYLTTLNAQKESVE